MSINESLKAKFDSLAPHLNERLTRIWAATEAIALGRGGITEVSKATGLSPKTIRVGIRELDLKSGSSSLAHPSAKKDSWYWWWEKT
jgi:hypothetical protein